MIHLGAAIATGSVDDCIGVSKGFEKTGSRWCDVKDDGSAGMRDVVCKQSQLTMRACCSTSMMCCKLTGQQHGPERSCWEDS